MNKYSAVFLNGFRATGKSTLGKLLAEKLNWDFVEIDDEILKRSKKSASELTKNGANWKEFRAIEHDVLKNLVNKENIVVSCGGGLAVNDYFGEANRALIKKNKNVLIVLVTADESKIRQRIRNMEKSKKNTLRPILDEKKALSVQEKLVDLDENAKRKLQIDEIVSDSIDAYRKRKSSYNSLSNFQIDTTYLSIDEALDQILKFI
jgi:shikimate kinase